LPAVWQRWHKSWVNCSKLHATSTASNMVRLPLLVLENGEREPQARECLAFGVKYTICEAPMKRKEYSMRYLAPIKPEHIPAVALPLERCVYCWSVLHPTLTYPASWSSTCCPAHRTWVLTHYSRVRSERSLEIEGSSKRGVALAVTQRMTEGQS
jgi:hypothetical protein